jgi:hypothetical protein
MTNKSNSQNQAIPSMPLVTVVMGCHREGRQPTECSQHCRSQVYQKWLYHQPLSLTSTNAPLTLFSTKEKNVKLITDWLLLLFHLIVYFNFFSLCSGIDERKNFSI